MSTRTGLTDLLHRERIVLGSALALLFILAAIYTVAGTGMEMSALEMTRMAYMRDMPASHPPGDWTASFAILVFAMWWVMMMAMMLPSVAPAVLLYAALLGRTRDAGSAGSHAAVFLSGYLVAWAGFSLLAMLAQWGLEAAGMVSAGMMTLIDTTAGGLLLLAAGLFQFTRLKSVCLATCRSPAAFIARHHRRGTLGALRLGALHGAYCVGCCWALMVLLFVGGVMNLYWIVGLTLLVAVEKLVPHGDRVARIVGAGLALWGAAIIITGLA